MMRLGPDRPRPERFGREAGHDMPVDMRHHVPEEFIIDLGRRVYRVKGLRHERDLLHQSRPHVTVEMEQFGGMILGEEQRIAGKILVPVEYHVRVGEFDDPQVAIILPAPAHRTASHIHKVLLRNIRARIFFRFQ